MGEERSRSKHYERKFKIGSVSQILEDGRTIRGMGWDLGIKKMI